MSLINTSLAIPTAIPMIEDSENNFGFHKNIAEPNFNILIDENELSFLDRRKNIDIRTEFEYDINNIREIGFSGSRKPWLNNKIKILIHKSMKQIISPTEIKYLITELAKVTIDFYYIKKDKYIAFDLEGRIVESSDAEMDSISKVQARNIKKQIFLWHVGHDSFTGWSE